MDETVADLLGRLGEAGIGGSAFVIASIIEGTSRFFEGIATNADPLTQGIALTLAVVTINFFLSTDPYAKILDKLGLTALYNSWAHYILSEVNLVGKTLLGRDDANGLYGIESFDRTGILIGARWYTNPASRDVSWSLLTLGAFIPAGSFLLGFKLATPSPIEFDEEPNAAFLARVSRSFPSGGGVIIYPTPLPPPPDLSADSAINTWKQNVAPGTYYVIVAQTDAGNWLVVNSTQDQTQAQALLNLSYGQAKINSTKILRTVVV